MGSEPDSCIAGLHVPTNDAYHRDAFSDVRPSETFDVFHEIEQFVRNNPWPLLALGFLAGYLLARGKK